MRLGSEVRSKILIGKVKLSQFFLTKICNARLVLDNFFLSLGVEVVGDARTVYLHMDHR